MNPPIPFVLTKFSRISINQDPPVTSCLFCCPLMVFYIHFLNLSWIYISGRDGYFLNFSGHVDFFSRIWWSLWTLENASIHNTSYANFRNSQNPSASSPRILVSWGFPCLSLSSSAMYHVTLGLSLTRKDIFTCWCLFFLPAVSAYRSDDAFKISFKAGLKKGLHSVLWN